MSKFPPDCTLRRATPDDIAAYGEFCRRTFSETYRDHHDADALSRHVAATFDASRLRADLEGERRTVLAVTAGQEWVAYALLTAGDAPPEVHGTRPMEIARFYVGAAWHGRGVAAPLMDAVLDEARRQGGDAAWLCVWEHNPRALRFYLGMGFELLGRTTYIFDGVPENDHLLSIAL